jgi:succinate dehydrogenase / fumarate reductase cytochrome b subunit
MGTNPAVQIMVPALAAGFMIHIVFAFILSWQNWKARGSERYERKSTAKVNWASRNMLVLGLIVLGLLFVHLSQFWDRMQLQEWLGNEPVKSSVLIVEIFSNPLNVIMYIVWILALSVFS